MANQIFGHTEHHIAFQVFVIIDEDLSNQRLGARLEAKKMQMRWAVRMAILGAQQFPHWPVRWHGVAGGLDGAEPERPVLIRIKPSPQVHVRLVGVLVLVKAGRRRMPDIDLDPLDRWPSGSVTLRFAKSSGPDVGERTMLPPFGVSGE